MRGTVVTMSIVAGLAVPALAAPAQAATTFPRKAVQQTIEKQIVEVIGQKATGEVPVAQEVGERCGVLLQRHPHQRRGALPCARQARQRQDLRLRLAAERLRVRVLHAWTTA